MIQKLNETQYAIVREIAVAAGSLGASIGLLAALGSWGDTLEEDDVLQMLREENKKLRPKTKVLVDDSVSSKPGMSARSRLMHDISEMRVAISPIASRVRVLIDGYKWPHDVTPKDGHEMQANFTLAYRHMEDARMRLGKAIQAIDYDPQAQNLASALTLTPSAQEPSR